jgi:hypothetical protein
MSQSVSIKEHEIDASGIVLADLLSEGEIGCQNCRHPQRDSFEVSRLIEKDGEIQETPLVAILHICDECLTLIAAGNWKELLSRRHRDERARFSIFLKEWLDPC